MNYFLSSKIVPKLFFAMKYVFLFLVLALFSESLSAQNIDELKLLSGDILEIDVYKHNDLKQTCRVSNSGLINVSKSGKFSVKGQTTESLEKLIAKGFVKNSSIEDPQVIVRIKTPVPRKIYVQGFFKESKAIEVPYGQEIELRQVVAEVKGFKDGADVEHLEITRRIQWSKDKKISKIMVNMLELNNSPKQKPFFMEAGDIVFVRELENIRVIGAVNNPSSFKPTPGIPISFFKSVYKAGGFRKDAQRMFFSLIRDGKSFLLPINSIQPDDLNIDAVDKYLKMVQGSVSDELHAGDIVKILTVDNVYVDGFIERPGVFTISQEQTMTLRKILVLAGGAKEEANLSKIKILRDVNGKYKVVVIDLKKLRPSKKDAQTFNIFPGDFIYVPRSIL